jgi:hypothetical protein
LTAGIFLPSLGILIPSARQNSVGEADDGVSDLVGGEAIETEADPAGREGGEMEGLAVEEVQETQVGARLQRQGADHARDAGAIGADA